MMSSVVLATRGSALALWQANFIADQLRQYQVTAQLKIVKTTGDAVQDRFLHEIGGKGLFIKELEEAMRAGEADIAMHSLKDMPVKLPQGFCFAAIMKRHSVADAIIFKKSLYNRLGITPGQTLSAKDIAALGPMRVATSSLRRQALLTQLNSGISVQPIRGNVDTRIRKLEEQDWHALILAEASLDRLGIKDQHVHRLDPNWFVPCAGQGAIAIEISDGSPHFTAINKLNCAATHLQISIERRVLAALGGDCTMPFGCLVQPDPRHPQHLLGRVIVLDLTGRSAMATSNVDLQHLGDGQAMVDKLLDGLRSDGVNDILSTLNIAQRI